MSREILSTCLSANLRLLGILDALNRFPFEILTKNSFLDGFERHQLLAHHMSCCHAHNVRVLNFHIVFIAMSKLRTRTFLYFFGSVSVLV